MANYHEKADDGDTITFNLPGRHPIIGEKISIRVNRIDTPEIKGKCEKEKYDAQQAREMVADILKNAEQLDLKNLERGKRDEFKKKRGKHGRKIGKPTAFQKTAK